MPVDQPIADANDAPDILGGNRLGRIHRLGLGSRAGREAQSSAAFRGGRRRLVDGGGHDRAYRRP
jgi:hypothetical protein